MSSSASESTALHARVRRFALRSLYEGSRHEASLHEAAVHEAAVHEASLHEGASPVVPSGDMPLQSDSFEALALAIADYQRRNCPGVARLAVRHGTELESVDAIPAVPSAAFRVARVAAHGAEHDTACFETSGTTGSVRGRHPFRTLETYETLALAFGRRALLPAGVPRAVVTALAPGPPTPNRSSLAFMLALFIERLDGVSKASPDFSRRWLLQDGAYSSDDLARAAEHADRSGLPLLLLGTSFALAALADLLAATRLSLPERTFVMETGGMKLRPSKRSLPELRAYAAEVLGVPSTHIISEYGMTELSSQLYTGTLPGGALEGPPGVYLEPPWLRVVPVDPVSLAPVKDGDIGIARIIDLGNVDSAVAVLTEDRVRRNGPGIELLGREPDAPERGCSLAAETWFAARGARAEGHVA